MPNAVHFLSTQAWIYDLTVFYQVINVITVPVQIKSFAELRVPLDDQFYMGNCKGCRSPLNTDMLLLNTPHFFTIGKRVCLE
jgi:hypothetical protein